MRMKYAVVAAVAVCAFGGFGKDIYLLLGQSNMAGRGKLGDEAPVPCERIEKLEASYVERLAKMVAALRAELGLKAEDVPFIFGSLAELEGAPNYEVNRSFNRAVRSAVDRIPNSVRVEGSDLSCNEDKVHFSTRSLRTLGARYAAAYLALSGGAR